MAFETPFVPRELMYVIIGLMMARSWFMESNDILKDTIIDAISHIWHCIVAIYSFHLIVSSFKQRYHSILEKTFDFNDLKKSDKGRWFRVDNEVYWISIDHTVRAIQYGPYYIIAPKTVPNWIFQSVYRERVPTVSTTTLKESNVFCCAARWPAQIQIYCILLHKLIFVVEILHFWC